MRKYSFAGRWVISGTAFLWLRHPVVRRRATGVRGQTDLARLARVTQPRMTQIMNLTFLAPDIQKAILLLNGDADVSEKLLRPITVEPSWEAQRRMWADIR